MKVEGPYQRLLSGYGSEKVPLAMDKQALLTCMLACRLYVNKLKA